MAEDKVRELAEKIRFNRFEDIERIIGKGLASIQEDARRQIEVWEHAHGEWLKCGFALFALVEAAEQQMSQATEKRTRYWHELCEVGFAIGAVTPENNLQLGEVVKAKLAEARAERDEAQEDALKAIAKAGTARAEGMREAAAAICAFCAGDQYFGLDVAPAKLVNGRWCHGTKRGDLIPSCSAAVIHERAAEAQKGGQPDDGRSQCSVTATGATSEGDTPIVDDDFPRMAHMFDGQIRYYLDRMPKIVCLCGSTRFWEKFRDKGLELTLQGCIVLSIGVCAPDSMVLAHPESYEGKKQKEALDELHKRKIDLADEVLVLNVGDYIGESTKSEIKYALAAGKLVRYLEPHSLTGAQ